MVDDLSHVLKWCSSVIDSAYLLFIQSRAHYMDVWINVSSTEALKFQGSEVCGFESI